MTPAALGIRMHSGWGTLVAVSGNADSLEILHRRRINIVDPADRGGRQPYHYAASLGLPEAERYLASCAAVAERLALAAVEEVVRELDSGQHCLRGSALLVASGRPLPPLSRILAAHPLIHAAEGEFFRNSVRKACELLQISVTVIRERELEERAKQAFGLAASRVSRRISRLGSSIGPPWNKDHKTAALAAATVLACP